jgi:hypothetical protein
MTMWPTLRFPTEQPRWATNSGRLLEPSSGAKDVGWSDDNKPPARWQNWLQNTVWDWLRRSAAVPVSNWFWNGDDIGAEDIWGLTYHPDLEDGQWVAATRDSSPTQIQSSTSLNGMAWNELVGTIAGKLLSPRTLIIDLTRYLLGTTTGEIYWSTNGTAWAADSALIALAPTWALASKYPDSSFLVAGMDDPGVIRFASGGVGTSWSTPTTGPSTSDFISTIVRVGSTTWIAVTKNPAECFISSDDCDNWADTTHPNTVVAGLYVDHAAYDAGTGTLIVVGKTGASPPFTPQVLFSRDLGTSWTQATVNKHEHLTTFQLTSMYACGGGIWVAGGTQGGSTEDVCLLMVSYDDGENWFPATYHSHDARAFSVMLSNVASDGRKLVAAGRSGFICHSLALPGKMGV